MRDFSTTVPFCYLCGEPLDWSDRQGIVFDHKIATIWGGATNVENLAPVHLLCNLSKSGKLITLGN